MPTHSKEYENEELNYFRICHLSTNILSPALRTVFKQEWDTRYKATHGEWLNTSKNIADFYKGESPGNQKKLDREPLLVIKNGNSDEWDCTCLFFAILNSTTIRKTINSSTEKNVKSLQNFRNRSFAHVARGKVSDSQFQKDIQVVIDSFKALGLCTDQVESIMKETTFETKDLNALKEQFRKEKERSQKLEEQFRKEQETSGKFEKQLKVLEKEMNAAPISFCSLPPRPSHETVMRSNEVSNILLEMENLRKKDAEKKDVVVMYLSGNPGCGKSQLAREVGERVYENIEETCPVFVMTLDAKNLDTLQDSYTKFACLLKCTEYAVSNATFKDHTQKQKLSNLKGLIIGKVRQYSTRWLIIADNVTDLKSVNQYLPQPGAEELGKGQVLVTTHDTHSIPLTHSRSHHISFSSGMEPRDAAELLSRISNASNEDINEQEVAMRLDYQPLALACAATYLKCTGITWQQYLIKLEEGKREATENVYESTNLSYPISMTKAIELNVRHEIESRVILQHAFEYFSLLAPEEIPLQCIERYVLAMSPEVDEHVVKATILNSSLVLRRSDDQKEFVRVHQVTHAILRTKVFPKMKENENCVAGAILSFDSLFCESDFDDINFIFFSTVLTQHFCFLFEAVEMLCAKKTTINRDIDIVLNYFGTICTQHGKYEVGKKYSQQSLALQKAMYGNSHPVLGRTLDNLGLVCQALGQHDEAREYHQQSLEIKERVYGSSHPYVAVTLTNFGSVYQALGQYDEAKKFHQQALAIIETVYGNSHPDVAIHLNNLGVVCSNLSEYGEAKKYHQQALAVKETVYGNSHPYVASTLNNLGIVCKHLSEYDEAKKYYQQALKICQSVYGSCHPKVASKLHNLGSVYQAVGQYDEARKYYQQALGILVTVYDNSHPDVGSTLNNLGIVCDDLCEYGEARKYYQQALAISETVYGNSHPDVANALNNLGVVCINLSEFDEAKKYYQQALEINQSVYGSCHPNVATTLRNLGSVYEALTQYDEARTYYQQALAISETVYCNSHPDVAGTLNDLGVVCSILSEYDEAKKYHQQALEINQSVYGSCHPNVASTLDNLGSDFQALGQQLAIKEPLFGNSHPDVAATLHNIGVACEALGQYTDARKSFQQVLAIEEAVFGNSHKHVARTLHNLGVVCSHLDEPEEAAHYYRRALIIKEAVYDKSHPKIANTLTGLGIVCRRLDQQDEAIIYYQQAFTIQKSFGGDVHPDAAKTLHNLGVLYRKVGRYDEATNYYQQALAIKKDVYGDDSPKVVCYVEKMKRYFHRAETALKGNLSLEKEEKGKKKED